MFRPNRLKRRLSAGERSTGCWLFMGSPSAAEILSHCGFDALIVDHEHSPGSLETAVAQFRAMQGADVTPLVRLSENTPKEVRHALDAGTGGIIASTVESAAEVEALVRSSHYPPVGRRGLHHTVGRAATWGLNGDDYFEQVHDNLLVIAMIESVAGVRSLAEMTRVARLDMLFVGPLDLSASLGVPGRYDDPLFVEVLNEIERRTLESRVVLGSTALPGRPAPALFERGYSFVTVASDVTLLRDSAVMAASAAKPRAEE